MAQPDSLTAPAPAKINLVLEVIGRRADGYHEVDTILQTLELADSITLTRGVPRGLRVSGPFAAATPANDSNLAWRAAAQFARLAGESLDGIEIAIEKRIPAAAGLGGGASDAATTLRLLGRWWPAPEDRLLAAAAAVGSDSPFFLAGGTARARGRGERVTPLPTLPRHGVVLFLPPETLELKTVRAFAALALHPYDAGGVTAAFAAASPPAFSSADVHNAFERVAFDLFPGLARLWEALEARTGGPIRLAGAGPTLFWIGPEARTAAIAAAGEGLACTTIPTATAGPLWRP